MNDIFSEDELRQITGHDQPAAQERLLVSMGLRVFRNAANRVILSREAFVRWQLGENLSTKRPKLKPI